MDHRSFEENFRRAPAPDIGESCYYKTIDSAAIQINGSRRHTVTTTAFSLCLFSGVLLVLTFPKFDLWPLSTVALVPLLLAARNERNGARRFLCGYAAGCVFFAGTCYWVYSVMRNYGGLGTAASAGVFALFSLVLALYFGGFTYLGGFLWNQPWGPPAMALLWVALEYARSYLLSGFPWLLLGYSLTGWFGIARIARWTGVYGLSCLIVTFNVALAWIWIRRARWPAAILIATVLVVIVLAITARRETYRPDQKAYLVQTNVPEEIAYQPWTPEVQNPLLNRLKSLTVGAVGRQSSPSLVIWPEMPAPFYFEPGSFARAYAEGIARDTNSYFLLGIVGFVPGSQQTEPLNSAVLLSPGGGIVSQYDKIHLVPFGEYVPLKRWLGFADKLTAEVSDFVPGNRYVVSELPDGRMADVICYEAVFPDLVRRFVQNGAEVLVNTSNDGWYGRSAARYQLLLMARMRAIENARYLLRATNTGITVIIQPDGKISSRLQPDGAGVLEGSWAFERGVTFYTKHGDWFAIGACILSVAALIATLPRRMRRQVAQYEPRED